MKIILITLLILLSFTICDNEILRKKEYIQNYTCDDFSTNIIIELQDTIIQKDIYYFYEIKMIVDNITLSTQNGYMFTKKKNLFLATEFNFLNKNISIKDRSWLFFNGQLTVETPPSIFYHHGLYFFRGTHHIDSIIYNEEIQDTVYTIELPRGDNDYFDGYKFSKKYGFLEFEHYYPFKGQRITTFCKCDTLKRFPLFE